MALAGPGRLHPAPPRPSRHHRPTAAMGTAPAQHPADAGSRPPRVSAIALRGGLAGQHAETLRTLARSPPGQPCRACQAVSGDQENPVTTTTTPGAPAAATAALPGTHRVKSQAKTRTRLSELARKVGEMRIARSRSRAAAWAAVSGAPPRPDVHVTWPIGHSVAKHPWNRPSIRGPYIPRGSGRP